MKGTKESCTFAKSKKKEEKKTRNIPLLFFFFFSSITKRMHLIEIDGVYFYFLFAVVCAVSILQNRVLLFQLFDFCFHVIVIISMLFFYEHKKAHSEGKNWQYNIVAYLYGFDESSSFST